jgi:chitinase
VSGSTTYKDLCSDTTAPYSCAVDTSTLADGTYSFRAVATDVAGNSTTSAVVGNRAVDNSVTSVVLADPGAILTGTVSLSASASSTAGVASVKVQRAAAGTGVWTDVCTDTTSPYTCS